MHPIANEDIWITTESGRIYAKRWTPNHTSNDAPIVLLHDSLGCVALWRDFPEQLAGATGREVVAYDRLGFGKSDPYRGSWVSTLFIERQQLRLAHCAISWR